MPTASPGLKPQASNTNRAPPMAQLGVTVWLMLAGMPEQSEDLSGLNITGMSARLGSLNSSAVTSQGAESVNGYSTTKYAIDTTSADSTDKQTFETLFGKGSFEKGTVWIQADGCAVKLVLDEGLQQTDGSVKKAHYEMAMIKE